MMLNLQDEGWLAPSIYLIWKVKDEQDCIAELVEKLQKWDAKKKL